MGQQQLLLIILGVIVVGIAVVVGITMFQDNAISANRDAVTNDLVSLGARAQQYYRRPTPVGGGGVSFVGLTNGEAGRTGDRFAMGKSERHVRGHWDAYSNRVRLEGSWIRA